MIDLITLVCFLDNYIDDNKSLKTDYINSYYEYRSKIISKQNLFTIIPNELN
jgi:hypothetical protein